MLYLDTNHFDNHCTCKCMLSQPFALKGKSLTNCFHSWTSSTPLNINAYKTKFIWSGTLHLQFKMLDFAFLSEQFTLIYLSSSVRYLGVTLYSSLTFTELC